VIEDLTYAAAHRDWMGYAKDLELTVLHDDGLYRHLRFRSPNGWFSYDLVTWPGHLYVGGGLDGYTFVRLDDMFTFFADSNEGRINPSYWQEKITAAGRPAREWSPELFKSAVVEHFWSRRERFPKALPLWSKIREELLRTSDWEVSVSEYADTARAALDAFYYYSDDHGEFTFGDWQEWNTTEWSPHYLRACWAIVWGISQYRAQTATAVGGAR
jgi:hypothetical protein